ncbi:MAG: tetratricopeptide repeat protein [Betaproteobacteria bacterium]|nr:tetratricopeptide repeat protein [Betaproteobacteria bacterium]
MTSEIEQSARKALGHHQSGQIREAERLYLEVLRVEPRHGDVNHNMGALLVQTGKPGAALPYLKAAVQSDSTKGRYWLSYVEALLASGNAQDASIVIDEARRRGLEGAEADALRRRAAAAARPAPSPDEIDALVALCSANRHAEAEAAAREMNQTWPQHGFGWKVLGTVLAGQGRLDEAVAAFQRALELLPPDAGTHHELGNALQALGRLPESEASYRHAIELKPDFHEAYYNLGNALGSLGRTAEAESSYRRAIELKADFFEAHYNLGNALQTLGRPSDAEASYRRAIEFRPDLYQAHSNLGTALQSLGRSSEAVACYRRALELKPDFHIACDNLGNALQSLGRYSEAEASYRRALELKPDFHRAHNNLGGVLLAVGRPSEAEASYRRAIELKPDFHEAHDNRGNALKDLNRLSEAEASYRRALELNPDLHTAHSNLIFSLDLREDCSIAEHQAERRRWYARHGQGFAASIKPHENPPDPERTLRVGYVSADFRTHSASAIFAPVIRLHDKAAFEVFCYSGVKREDEVTARLRQAAHAWRSTLGIPDEALAEQIRSDGIDILVDLAGHSAGNRLLVFARKPAPVQVTAWGYANGTGVETIDYLFGDPVTVPLEERSLYAEEVFDLPCWMCYEPPEYLPEISLLPALGGKAFTFGCINRIEKISDRAIALWGRILAAAPGSRLLVKHRGLDEPGVRNALLERLRNTGVGAERVQLVGSSAHADHLKIYHEVDVGLDPFPHGGGVSTAEALSMGVPVVARMGDTVPGRVSASILTVLGMPEWIARSDEEYVRIALETARDIPRLARTREGLRSRIAESAMGDVERYTRAVEGGYRTMWRRWCAGVAAGSLEAKEFDAATRS